MVCSQHLFLPSAKMTGLTNQHGVTTRGFGRRRVEISSGLCWRKFTGSGPRAPSPLKHTRLLPAQPRLSWIWGQTCLPACLRTPREWATASLFLTAPHPPSSSHSLTEGMYFRRDPWWCDGHESLRLKWKPPHSALPGSAGNIPTQPGGEEMEQANKNSRLYWGFPLENTGKYRKHALNEETWCCAEP